MKKTKILTVLGVLLAMGITACGGNKSSAKPTPSSSSSQPAPSSSSQPAPSSSSSSSSVAPTPTKDATGHIWGADADVAASGEGVAYKKASCTENDQFIKLTINESVVTNANRKSGTPDGYLKLSSDGNECSFKFNYDSYAEGKLYLFGCMDGYSSNLTKNFCYVNSNPNVEVKINGETVDISEQKDVKFQDIFGEESTGDNLSNDNYALLGNIAIENGVNEVNYKRLQTLNMLVKDFVLVVKNGTKPAHEHTADTEWHSDETGHWHECTAKDGYKMNSEAHAFVEVTPEEDKESDAAHKAKAATCSEEGIKVEVCSVCNYRKETKLDKTAHTFPEDGGWTVTKEANCDEAGEREHKCTVCEEVVKEAIPALGHDFSGGVAKAYEAGEGYIASQAVNCEKCTKSALKWSALDYDKDLSAAASDEGKNPKSQDSDKAIQLDTSTVQGGGENHDQKGCHIIYSVNVPEAVEGAGLSMLATEAPYRADMFDAMDMENSKGYIQNEAGEWVRPASRYGIKVDGVEYMVAKNGGAIKGAGTAWYQFPGISLTLTAGVHKFEFFKYGGYDVNHYEFMLIGLSHVEPAHIHTLSDWQSDDNNHWKVCTGEGCLDPEDTKYESGAHEWGDVVVSTPATCTTDGAGTKKCTVCGKTVDVVIPAAHTWGAAQPVEATEGKAAYDLFECSACNCKKIEVKLLESMVTGTNKNDPAGFIKLKNKNEYFSFSFDYDSAAFGKIYQRGVMDGWSSNKGKNVFSGGTNGADDFELTVNGNKVDVSAYKSQKWQDIMVEGQNGLSAITDVESGSINLIKGTNTVKYERLASYNMPLTHIVFVFEDTSHEHHAGSEWQSDDAQHWHVCDAAGCPTPTEKMEAAAHTWDEGVVVTPADHNNEGEKKLTCTVCGHVKIEKIPAVAHSWTEGTPANNSDEKAVTPLSCSCGKVGAKMAFKDFSSCTDEAITAESTSFKLNGDAANSITFKIVVSKAGTYRLDTFAKYSQGNSGQSLATAPYTVSVNGVDAPVSSGTYKELGMNSSSAAQFILVPTMTLAEGENTIVIAQGTGGYRLTFSDSIIVYEK